MRSGPSIAKGAVIQNFCNIRRFSRDQPSEFNTIMWTQTLTRTSSLLAVSFVAVAGPLDKSKIASDAKWLVHIDADGLRNSSLGRYVIKDLVNPALESCEELKHANLSMNVTNISSVTAYGPAFDKSAEGVL